MRESSGKGVSTTCQALGIVLTEVAHNGQVGIPKESEHAHVSAVAQFVGNLWGELFPGGLHLAA
jgi:hypothetical protein